MKVKTATLIGPALDYAALLAQGMSKTDLATLVQDVVEDPGRRRLKNSPSTDWSRGGPLIEREHISVDNRKGDPCRAFKGTPAHYEFSMFAPEGQPLIAACRCLVASVLGDEVDVPDELV